MAAPYIFPVQQIAVNRSEYFPYRPTIVFLHDSLGCIELWRDFPKLLGEKSGCNVLVYDRQGYGKSCPFTDAERENTYIEKEADFLSELLDFWKLDQVILFGHSDGGSIALIAAAKYPEKIKAVITEGAHVFVEEITVNGIKQAVVQYRETNLKAKLEKYHGDKTEALFLAWTDTWTSERFQSWNIEDFLPKIKCPLLVIQGEDDEFGTLEQVEKIVRKTSAKAEKLIIPDTRHTPHKEIPELVLEATTAFIRSVV